MLAAQIAAIHMATMTFARRRAHVDTAEHVTVNEGGQAIVGTVQAIVGNVVLGGRGSSKNKGASS